MGLGGSGGLGTLGGIGVVQASFLWEAIALRLPLLLGCMDAPQIYLEDLIVSVYMQFPDEPFFAVWMARSWCTMGG